MNSTVSILAGPACSGKSTHLLSLYRDALQASAPGQLLWLAPTGRGARDIAERLIRSGLKSCFQPGICTFARLAALILEHAPKPIKPLSPGMKRELLEGLVRDFTQQGRLGYFRPIAETGGFLDQVSGFIAELKRFEVWPEDFQRTCHDRGDTRCHELAMIYGAYQQRLLEHQLYDQEGLFWEARDLLSKGQVEPYAPVRLVVVDGFTDFSRTQHEILEILSRRVERIFISLPLERDTQRGDLFRKTQQTLTELEKRHGNPLIQWFDRPARSWAGWSQLERSLFSDPRQVQPAVDSAGLEILAAARQEGEIETIGRKIKRLLTAGDDAIVDRPNGPPPANEPPRRNPSSQRDAAAVFSAQSQPVAPQDIVVVFRQVAEVAPLIRETFGELGIPFALDHREKLQTSAPLRLLANLIELHLADWPFRALLAVLSHASFQPSWLEFRGRRAEEAQCIRMATERIIRELQFPNGAEELVNRVAQLAAVPDAQTPAIEERAAREQQRLCPWARLAAPLLARVAATLAELPQQGTPHQWAEALERLGHELGLAPSSSAPGQAPSTASTSTAPAAAAESAAADRAAWAAFFSTLRASGRLAEFLDERPPQWDGAALLHRVRNVLAEENLPGATDEVGRVRIVSAQSLRSLRVPYLFVAGLSEQSFPRSDSGGRLFDEADQQLLRDAGHRLPDRVERGQEEMLLFYELLTRATRRLILSYPGLDAKAQPLSPSPYVREVQRACGEAIPVENQFDLNPAAAASQLLCPSDWRLYSVQSVEEAARANRETAEAAEPARWLAGLLQANTRLADNLTAALRTIQARKSGTNYGPFEGVLTGQAVQDRLAGRFGPDYCWSASQLEEYARCPHEYYLHRVLNVAPLPELSLELDSQQRGTLLHAVLAQLHRGLNEQHGGPTSAGAIDSARLMRFFTEALADCLERLRNDDPLNAALLELDRQKLLEWGAKYATQAAEYDAAAGEFADGFKPTHFEYAFGPRVGGDDVDQQSLPAPYELRYGKEVIKLSGRVDRIDIGRVGGQTVFNLIDYKSGGSRALKVEEVEAGYALQLPLYALVAQEILLADRAASPWLIGYWFIQEKGFDAKKSIRAGSLAGETLAPSEVWTALRKQIVERVVSLVHGIRRAEFPMHSHAEDCTSKCEFKTVCRVQQTRALGKTWQPPAT
ncbi:MAG TPA: PD-(D/E)XK nuclease family protein [Pirellulales bacterium]|jgi:ATP-dependent helicase/DNAse subunit B|nr:PD-(D/E)XK nuclease family protein [Pirellulales bacterium]